MNWEFVEVHSWTEFLLQYLDLMTLFLHQDQQFSVVEEEDAPQWTAL